MRAEHVEERRRFISDAFHTLNQPLTGLHCGLEIALQKPRSEGEYRDRIGRGVEYAGEIVALIRAIRQLVDAADPGEQFGIVALATVLAQVKSELEVMVEATGVTLRMDCESAAQVKADPAKLATALGGLIASAIESRERGGTIAVRAKSTKKYATLCVDTSGAKLAKEAANRKLTEIRRNAAISYLWTIGGEVQDSGNELTIKLPAGR